jgi:hypothetical protein
VLKLKSHLDKFFNQLEDNDKLAIADVNNIKDIINYNKFAQNTQFL